MRRALLIVALCSLLVPSLASAKDLRKKVGIGFNNNFSSVSALSVKLGLPTDKETVNVQIQGLVGFSLTPTALERFFAGGRVLLPFIAEDNLNVYGGIGGGYVRFSTDSSAARIQAVLGVEFFMFGLERLGVSAEFGVNLDVAPGVFELATTSGTSASVGVHYYFGK
jgi:hypothetical protein